MRTVSRRVAVALVVGGALSSIFVLAIIHSGKSRARDRGARPVAFPRQRHGQKRSRPAPHVRARAMPPASGPLPRPESASAPTSIPKMVGQRFMVGLRGNIPAPALLEDARRGKIGGVVIFPTQPEPSLAANGATELQLAAKEGGNPDLLVATDQEGGPIKRFPEGPPTVSPSRMNSKSAFAQGIKTGDFLLERRINVDLAPVADLGLSESFMTREGRTISSRPGKVARVANRFAVGLRSRQVMPVAKHFPGLGMATVNTDEARSEISGPVSQSLYPYRYMIRRELPAIMVSTAIYTSIDPGNAAAWSPRIVQGLLRRHLHFGGLVFSDDLATPGVHSALSTSEAAIKAAQAGVDVIMIGNPNEFSAAYRAVLTAAKEGRIPRSNLEQSYEEIVAAKVQHP
jgi:beta-N-acetylhexosaminidase